MDEKVKTKFVAKVTVIDPDSGGEVEVEIRKMETGPMVGIDGKATLLSKFSQRRVVRIPLRILMCICSRANVVFVKKFAKEIKQERAQRDAERQAKFSQ